MESSGRLFAFVKLSGIPFDGACRYQSVSIVIMAAAFVGIGNMNLAYKEPLK